MTDVPLVGVSARFGALIAAVGLAAVAALSVPDIGDTARLALKVLLVGIWLLYALQLANTVRDKRGDRGDRMAALVVDLLAVVLPLAGLFVTDARDQALFCAIWLLKPLRDSVFFRLMGRVLSNEARNLIGVASIFLILLFAAAIAAYLLERNVQPESFGTIPKAMWWAVVTLSTTGYGDKIPQTFGGRVVAGMVMMSGIGVFALWAGILATGFAEEVRRQDFIDKWRLVAAVPLFRRLGPNELVEIVRALRPRNFPAGAVICRKGEKGDRMFFIVEGGVTVAAASPIELGAGNFFGEMALVTGEPRSATVTAATATSLLSLDALDFQVLSSRNPEIAEVIRKTAEERRGPVSGQ